MSRGAIVRFEAVDPTSPDEVATPQHRADKGMNPKGILLKARTFESSQKKGSSMDKGSSHRDRRYSTPTPSLASLKMQNSSRLEESYRDHGRERRHGATASDSRPRSSRRRSMSVGPLNSGHQDQHQQVHHDYYLPHATTLPAPPSYYHSSKDKAPPYALSSTTSALGGGAGGPGARQQPYPQQYQPPQQIPVAQQQPYEACPRQLLSPRRSQSFTPALRHPHHPSSSPSSTSKRSSSHNRRGESVSATRWHADDTLMKAYGVAYGHPGYAYQAPPYEHSTSLVVPGGGIPKAGSTSSSGYPGTGMPGSLEGAPAGFLYGLASTATQSSAAYTPPMPGDKRSLPSDSLDRARQRDREDRGRARARDSMDKHQHRNAKPTPSLNDVAVDRQLRTPNVHWNVGFPYSSAVDAQSGMRAMGLNGFATLPAIDKFSIRFDVNGAQGSLRSFYRSIKVRGSHAHVFNGSTIFLVTQMDVVNAIHGFFQAPITREEYAKLTGAEVKVVMEAQKRRAGRGSHGFGDPLRIDLLGDTVKFEGVDVREIRDRKITFRIKLGRWPY